MRLLRLPPTVRGMLLAWAALLPAAAPATAQTGLRLVLEGRMGGPEAPFALAQDRGYYRSEGLDVTVEEAAQPLEPITRVNGGSHDIAFADINTLIRYRDQNPSAAAKAVFMVYNAPPYSIVARRSRGISEPRQLEGRKLGAPPTGTAFNPWPLFAKVNGIDPSKVVLETVGGPVLVPMLAAGQIDAAVGTSFRLYIDLKDRGVPLGDIVLMPMWSHGLKLYGNALIANGRLAGERPEVLSAFLRAYLRALKETIRRPAEAVEAVIRRDDGAKREVELERLRMAIRDNIVTPEVRANGLGGVERARLEESIEQLALVTAFKSKPKPEDVFNAGFLPVAAERRVN
jgi:NitT/TauT family transport system substrate-binding protein